MKRFIGKGTDLKIYSLFDREPVKLTAKGGYVIGPFGRGEDKAYKGILNQLKSM